MKYHCKNYETTWSLAYSSDKLRNVNKHTIKALSMEPCLLLPDLIVRDIAGALCLSHFLNIC